jgi:putative lipoprotein
MLMRALQPLAAVATLVLVASCSGPGETTTAETTPPALMGSTWLAEDIGGRGVIDRARTTISFEPEGRVAGSGGCNRYFGSVTIKGDAITFSEKLGATMMACAPALMDQERKFFDALAATRLYRFDDPGHELVFLGEDGALLLRFSQVTL